MIRLGSTWRNRRSRRLAVVVRVPTRRQSLEYRYLEPERRGVTLYTRPFVSTRPETVQRFRARFVEVNDSASPNASRAPP